MKQTMCQDSGQKGILPWEDRILDSIKTSIICKEANYVSGQKSIQLWEVRILAKPAMQESVNFHNLQMWFKAQQLTHMSDIPVWEDDSPRWLR